MSVVGMGDCGPEKNLYEFNLNQSDIDAYAKAARTTAIYPSTNKGDYDEYAYLTLGLLGEAGEVAGKIKKWHRDGNLDKVALSKELGDVLWYWANLCTVLGVDPSTVMNENLDKLFDRKARGVLGGSGDNR